MIREGKLELCPFRIYEETHMPMLKGQGAVKTQHFMPCMKEKCICYDVSFENRKVTEYCYRDNLVYKMQHPESEVQG